MTSAALRSAARLCGLNEQGSFSKCFTDQQMGQKTSRQWIWAASICTHPQKCELSHRVWTCRPQGPEWPNKGWHRMSLFLFYTFAKLVAFCMSPKRLGQCWLPSWNLNTAMYTWPSLRFLYWKVSLFSSPCPADLRPSVPAAPCPLSPCTDPSRLLSVPAIVSGVPQCASSLLYLCETNPGLECLWVLIHAV